MHAYVIKECVAPKYHYNYGPSLSLWLSVVYSARRCPSCDTLPCMRALACTFSQIARKRRRGGCRKRRRKSSSVGERRLINLYLECVLCARASSNELRRSKSADGCRCCPFDPALLYEHAHYWRGRALTTTTTRTRQNAHTLKLRGLMIPLLCPPATTATFGVAHKQSIILFIIIVVRLLLLLILLQIYNVTNSFPLIEAYIICVYLYFHLVWNWWLRAAVNENKWKKN